jgi:hypothetical protein
VRLKIVQIENPTYFGEFRVPSYVYTGILMSSNSGKQFIGSSQGQQAGAAEVLKFYGEERQVEIMFFLLIERIRFTAMGATLNLSLS